MSNLQIGNKKRKFTTIRLPWNKVIFFLLVIYLCLLFYITLFAWNYGSSYGPVGPGGRNYNIILFESIFRIAVYSTDFMDPLTILGGNIVMFIPFGILITLWCRSSSFSFWITLICSVLLSTFIELNQFIFTFRVANVDDVFLNTCGAVTGSLLVISSKWIIKKFLYL